jgi:hypothetical protein
VVVLRRPGRIGRWMPVLAAAAVVLALAGSLSAVRFGVLHAPGLASVVGRAGGGDGRAKGADPLPVYLIQRQHDRWALVREYTPTSLTDRSERLTAALRLAVSGSATDPDLTSAWNVLGLTGEVRSQLRVGPGDQITGLVVTLASSLLGTARPATAARDSTLATLAVQQLVWTATATTGAVTSVRVTGEDGAAHLFGVEALDREFARGAGPDDPRAPVWVSTLREGQQLRQGAATVSGDAIVTEAGTVSWSLDRPDGSVAASGAVELLRQDGQRPRPGERALWQLSLPLAQHGRFVFRVRQSWPDGDPGAPAWEDTKSVTVI